MPGWPKFRFALDAMAELEKQFLLNVGESAAFLKSINIEDHKQFIVEILSQEGSESSRIEGEILAI